MVRRAVDAPTEEAWARLTDFGGYGRWIPFTEMVLDPEPVRVGWGFAGRTGVGPLGFVDSMLVTRWEPPGRDGSARFSVRKTGRLLGGWADIRLESRGDGGTDLSWAEEIVLHPSWLGRRIARLVDPVVARIFGRAVDRMLAAADHR